MMTEDVPANGLSVQRATAIKLLRAEVKLDTDAHLSEAGSYTSAVLRRPLPGTDLAKYHRVSCRRSLLYSPSEFQQRVSQI